ncbi:MAG: hypothetical protein H6923_00340 [Alphaproteobacteria bacterium]|nr:hypothetical protein [Alphaproteobacteria bacterium]
MLVAKTRRAPNLAAFLLGLTVLGGSQAVAADSPKLIGTFNDWNAFEMVTDNQRICFVASEPKDTSLSKPNASRGNVYFLITNWVDRGIKGEPSVVIGYPQKEGSRTLVEIGSDKFEMFTQGDGAWFADPDTEQKVVNAMKRGATMRVRGISTRDTRSSDTYSLKGITAALQKINEQCK